MAPLLEQVLPYLVTRDEYLVLSKRLQTFAAKAGAPLKLPRLPEDGARSDVKATSTALAAEDAQSSLLPSVSRRALRLFLLAYGVTNCYENILIGILKRKRPSQFLRDLPSLSALRLAAFISSYSAIYRLSLSHLRRITSFVPFSPPSSPSTLSRRRIRATLVEVLRSQGLAPFVAALVAAPTMLIEGGGKRRTSIAVYALTRALQTQWGALVAKGVVPRALREGRWWWGGHLIFAVSNAILLHAFVFNPTSFPSSYSSLILRHSTAYVHPPTHPLTPWPTPSEIVSAIASSARSHYPPYHSPLLHPSSARAFAPDAYVRKILPILEETHPGHERLVCAFLHPHTVSCGSVFEGFVKAEFRSAAKFFGALALLGTAVRWRKFVKDPESGIFAAVTSTVTSSAFLSLSIGTAWSTICLFQKYLPNSFLPTKRFYLQGFLAGLWVALTTIGTGSGTRATDLGMYSARLALPCWWDVLVRAKKVRNIRNGEVVYFAVAMASVMALYEVKPEAIQSSFVRSALRKIAGESTADLKAVAKAEEEKKKK